VLLEMFHWLTSNHKFEAILQPSECYPCEAWHCDLCEWIREGSCSGKLIW
jgi:hypothetical protein